MSDNMIPNRLQMLLRKRLDLENKGILDCYNQRVWHDLSPTVTVRMPDSSNYFVYEEQKVGATSPE